MVRGLRQPDIPHVEEDLERAVAGLKAEILAYAGQQSLLPTRLYSIP